MAYSSILFKLVALLGVLFFGCASASAGVRSRVTISVLSHGEVTVRADLYTPSRSWSFRNAYAGVLGIAERIHEFRATTSDGKDAGAKRISTGEFRSDLDAQRIVYKVKVSEPTAADVSHTSWIVGDSGVLMLADLLSHDFTNISAEFVLPDGWHIATSNTRVDGQFEVVAPEKSVFLIGRSLRKSAATSVEEMDVQTILSGTWPFKDNDAQKAAARVIKKYLELTGFRLPGKSVILIAPLPVKVGSTNWKAETRGSTIVLLMNPAAPIKNWIGQLGVIFTHEALHLWVPNGLRLEGDYDWFFEGFTLYTALRTALELKIINFREFLDTLARVYDSYLSYADDLSLIEASERRWTTPGSLVYDKGMLVAFLYDLMLRKESGGKATLADRYRHLFNPGLADGAGGNEAIIRLLGVSPGTIDFTKSYIENSRELKLEHLVPVYGLQVESKGQKSQLKVSNKLDENQKQLLRSLGYRN